MPKRRTPKATPPQSAKPEASDRRRAADADATIDPTIPGAIEEWEDPAKSELQRALAYIELLSIEPAESAKAADVPPMLERETRELGERDGSPVTTRALVRGVRDLLGNRLTITEIERQILRVAHGEVAPQIEDAELRGAYRRASELIERLTTLRDELAAADTSRARRVEIATEIDALSLAAGPTKQLSEGRQDNLTRAEVINCFEYVGQLRLPEVLDALCDEGKVDRDRTARLMLPLLADATAVRALVALRRPEIAADIKDATAHEIIRRIRDQQGTGSKWDAYADLFEAVGLYTERVAGSRAGADTVEAQYRHAKPLKLGAAFFAQENRLRIWARLAEFFVATGLGEFTAEDADRIWRDRSAH